MFSFGLGGHPFPPKCARPPKLAFGIQRANLGSGVDQRGTLGKAKVTGLNVGGASEGGFAVLGSPNVGEVRPSRNHHRVVHAVEGDGCLILVEMGVVQTHVEA